MYSDDQIGANTQLGGLKLGSIISEYHGSLKEAVVKPPTPEACGATGLATYTRLKIETAGKVVGQ